ncbi:MAG TPA: Ku protein [Chloroflexi bacterium]|jgi:DNA end-binding protein Ku|nr:Ku protein [Chloroflexota bacterium]HAL25933.1 Ku protein [Chloroflexota bacterium]
MARSIWKGSLQFGMVNIPVALYVATESTSKVSFNLLCPDHRTRIKNKRWCPVGEHEVASTVKGYEYEKGQYVIFGEDDLEKLPLKSSRSIDIAGFIKDEELPGELYFQSAYYLEPDKSAQKPYALLKKTLEKTGRVAVAKFALRERERLVSMRAHDDVLVLNTLHWPDEIRSIEDLNLPEEVKVSPAELKMAESLVEMMAMRFDPSEFRDEYKQAFEQIVDAKVKGREDLVEAPEAEAETTVIDLMSALKASVAKAKEEEKKGGRAGRGGHESLVHRTSTSRTAAKTDKEKTARKKAS